MNVEELLEYVAENEDFTTLKIVDGKFSPLLEKIRQGEVYSVEPIINVHLIEGLSDYFLGIWARQAEKLGNGAQVYVAVWFDGGFLFTDPFVLEPVEDFQSFDPASHWAVEKYLTPISPAN